MSERQVFMRRVMTGLIFGILFWGVFLYAPPIFFSLLLALVALLIASFEWTNFYNINSWSFWLILPVYPLLPFGLLIAMNHVQAYRILLIFLFAIAFAHDTGSYIVGKMIGKNKIWPAISPNKTWEGFWGGYIFACVAMILICFEQVIHMAYPTMFVFTLMTCTLSFLGDIFESSFKRRAHIKDSGTMLPGHGGFLDRFDGILFTTYFFFVFKTYILSLMSF
jgi:phosphatidate cytidylyltransferase